MGGWATSEARDLADTARERTFDTARGTKDYAREFSADADRDNGRQWTSDATGTDALVRISPRLEPGADRLEAVSASWRRLASRVEGLVNRVIDEVADATERALVPALVGGVETLLEGRTARPAHRPAPAAGASAQVAAEGA